MREATSIYSAACDFACARLENAARYFPRLHELAKVNTLLELEAIIVGWAPKPKPVVPPNQWMPGSTWGDCIRVKHDRGIFWKLRCSCGELFDVSTNDTTPLERRKCPACLLAMDTSATKQQLIFKLESIAQTVLKWYQDYGKLVWDRVHRACRSRWIDDPQFARELHALCWVKIASVAGSYQDRGFKVSTWLARVADNAIRDYFKVTSNRARLVPLVPLPVDDRLPAAGVPARPTRPPGASPDDDDDDD